MAGLRVLAAALLAAAARATVIEVRDSWNSVSGMAVTVGGQLQPDVWRVRARTWRALATLDAAPGALDAGAMPFAALRMSSHHLTVHSPA